MAERTPVPQADLDVLRTRLSGAQLRKAANLRELRIGPEHAAVPVEQLEAAIAEIETYRALSDKKAAAAKKRRGDHARADERERKRKTDSRNDG